MPGGGITDTAMAATSAGGRLYLFARGIADKGVYVNVMTKGSWGGWRRIGTGTTTLAPSATTIGSTAWVSPVDDSVHHVWTAASTSAAWTRLERPGGGVTDAQVGAISGNGRVTLFAQGIADGRIYVNTT